MEKGDQVGGAIRQHRPLHLGRDELQVGGLPTLGQAPGAGEEGGVRLHPDDVEAPAARGPGSAGSALSVPDCPGSQPWGKGGTTKKQTDLRESSTPARPSAPTAMSMATGRSARRRGNMAQSFCQTSSG